jgi:hypothetical protein
MNVDIGTEVARFPEKEDRNGIFLAVLHTKPPVFREGTIVPSFVYTKVPSLPCHI